jgi:hypothetical protein
MAENKTKPTDASVTYFLDQIKESRKREDCFALLKMMESVSKEKPIMWGSSIVGFGLYHYVYESGREGDTVQLGFSPRKEAITIYMMCSLAHVADELPKLGKYKTGKGCLYIKSLKDVDAAVLRRILTKAWKVAKSKK